MEVDEVEHEELCEELRKLKDLDVAYYIYKVGGDEVEHERLCGRLRIANKE